MSKTTQSSKNKKKPPKPGTGYLLNRDTRKRNYPCNFSIKLYTNFNGFFDPLREVPCSITVVSAENKLGRAQRLPSTSVQASFLQNSKSQSEISTVTLSYIYSI